jgi:hypothetical protein
MAKTDNGLTFGMDVEFFLRRKNGKHVPVCGKVGGTKQAPIQFEGEEPGFMYQEDGAALELNSPICRSVEEFAARARWVHVLADQVASSLRMQISPYCDAPFDSERYSRLSKRYAQMYVIGCDPDFDAFASEDTPRLPYTIDDFGEGRFAGGHIHIGYDTNRMPPHIFVRTMAAFLGPMHCFDTNRYAYYGFPGLYRVKPYGIEYRSLSNKWVLDATQRDRVMLALTEMQTLWTTDLQAFYQKGVTFDRMALATAYWDGRGLEEWLDDIEEVA